MIDYVARKYRRADRPDGFPVSGIVTKGMQAAKSSIRNCARLLGDAEKGDSKAYTSLGDEMCKQIPGDDLKATIKKYEGTIRDHFSGRQELGTVMKILADAKLVEGKFSVFGAHAAGVIISDDGDISDFMPLMQTEDAEHKKRWVCQQDMVQAEESGALKMDFLGLRTLVIISDAIRMIEKEHGITIHPRDDIPFEPEVFKEIYAEGNTDGVFQFESAGMKKLLQSFGPENIEDLILLNAIFRPGPIQYVDEVTEVKHGKKVSYDIPELEPILKNTYGKPVYQEQVMMIFQQLAGYSLGQSDMVRRFMSKKKMDKLVHEREAFLHGDSSRNIAGCEANGIDPEAADRLFDELIDFAAYAFNKSHACAYSILSYYTAWLKYHYPAEFMCSLMDMSDYDKMGQYASICRKASWGPVPKGIAVRNPDINLSGSSFTVKDGAIYFGIGSVKGISGAGDMIVKEREENGPFRSFADFLARLDNPKKNVVESLIDSGAFDSFGNSRKALHEIYPASAALLKTMKDKRKVMEDETSGAKKAANAKAAYAAAEQELRGIAPDPAIVDDIMEKLEAEKRAIGLFVSDHPLNSYEVSGKHTDIAVLREGRRQSIMGCVSDLQIRFRKSDGKPMAFFSLEDTTGSVDVCVFTATFEEFRDLLRADAALKVTGQVRAEEFNGKEVLKMNAASIEELKKKTKTVIMDTRLDEWKKVREDIQDLVCDDGMKLILNDTLTRQMRPTRLRVSADILKRYRCAII